MLPADIQQVRAYVIDEQVDGRAHRYVKFTTPTNRVIDESTLELRPDHLNRKGDYPLDSTVSFLSPGTPVVLVVNAHDMDHKSVPYDRGTIVSAATMSRDEFLRRLEAQRSYEEMCRPIKERYAGEERGIKERYDTRIKQLERARDADIEGLRQRKATELAALGKEPLLEDLLQE